MYMIAMPHNRLRAASGTFPAAGHAKAFSPRIKAGVFIRAALKLEHPLYSVAMEGLFGGFGLPEKLERRYAERVSGGCDAGRLPDPEALRFILDRYLWAKKGYERVKGTCRCGCGAYDIGLTPSYMLAHYLDIARVAEANPKALAPRLVKETLGSISGLAKDLLARGLPIPEREGRF